MLLIILLLLLFLPQTSEAPAYAQNASPQKFPDPADLNNGSSFPDREDDIFSTTYERELLSRRIFKKSLPPLSRKEKISWSFKTARANALL